GNRFDFVSRTGIGVFGAERVWIDRNRLTNLFGTHANGISVYLDNTDVLVSNNLVSQASHALTFDGPSQGRAANRVSIRRNIFLVSGVDGSAIQSWGGAGLPSRQVEIVGNVIAGDERGRYALRLNAADEAVVVRFNVIDGLMLDGTPTDWTMADNVFTKDN